MKTIFLSFMLLISSQLFSQVYVEKTPLDSLSKLPYIGATLRVRYAYGEQTIRDYDMDIGKGGKMKLKDGKGNLIKIESFIGLVNILNENGWQLHQFSFIPKGIDKMDNSSWTSELFYSVVFTRK